MLKKSTVREIKSSIGRYIAILAIIALGVGVFSGLKMSEPAMVDTANDYLEKYNFYDYELITSYGIDAESEKIAKSDPAVKDAEASMQQDFIATVKWGKKARESVIKAISVPERINKLRLVNGRMPKTDNECVIDNYIAVQEGYEIGQIIEVSKNNTITDQDVFKQKSFKIVGMVNSPLYMDYGRGSTSVGNGTLETFIYINKTAFATDYSTQLYVKLKKNEYAYSSALNKLLKKYQKPMEALAQKISDARKDGAIGEAQKLLDEKRAELEQGEVEYNREYANTERELTNANNQILDGQSEVYLNESVLRDTLAELQSNRTQVVDGIAQCNDAIATAEAQYAAGEIEELEYQMTIYTANQTLQELNSYLTQIDDGIKQCQDGMAELEAGKKKVNDSKIEVSAAEETAAREFASARNELEKGKTALADAQAKIDEMETGLCFVMARSENSGYSSFENNAQIISNIAKIFPVFFFLVAALVVMTTMTRMIDEQRSQIGVLRALGYKKESIMGKYLFYSGSASLLGSIIGFFIGSWIFPMVIWKAYTMMYDFNPNINFMLDWKLGVLSTAAALLCAMGATWISCSKDFKEAPAELIRPKSPPAGKKILMEKWTGLWNKLSFSYKVSFRNVFRYKKRFIMMVLGICGCTALLVAGFGIKDSISGVAEHQFGEVSKYDYLVAFNENMDANNQKNFAEEAANTAGKYGETMFFYQGNGEIKLNGKKRELSIIATDDENINKFFNLSLNGKSVDMPGDGEILLCRKMKEQQGVKVGDKIKIREGYYEMTAKVAGFYDNYIEENMVMTLQTYEKYMGKKAAIRTAYVKSPDSFSEADTRAMSTKIAKVGSVAAVVVSHDIIDMVESMMKSLNSIVYVIILCAGLLAFIVLYNLTNINILERIREVATIKVLGFYQKETASYVFRENVILTAISVLIGLPLGKLLLTFIINSLQIDMIFFLPKLTVIDYLLAIVITFVFTLIVNTIMRPKLNKISMTESLKTTE